MHVIIAGSGDAFGSGGRFQTCIAVADHAAGQPHTLLDCGATSLTALRLQHLDPSMISTVVISHLHGDHFGGLPFLILDGQFRHRTADLTVGGPAPATGWPGPWTPCFPALPPRPAFRRARHRAPRPAGHAPGHAARDPLPGAPRLRRPRLRRPHRHAGRVPGYSGDTEWTDALLDAADGAGLFLCEGYRPRPIRWHLNLGTLAGHRTQLTCRRLMLTHLSPAALASDLAGWQVASDGLRLDL